MEILNKNNNHNSVHAPFETKDLEVGLCAVFDIYSKDDNRYIPLVKAGTPITKELYETISKKEPLYILKSDEKFKKFSCQNLQHYVKYNKKRYGSNPQFW